MTAEPVVRPRGAAHRPDRTVAPPPAPELEAAPRLTAMLLDVPIALICLVDGDHAWCEAHHGPAAAG
ncbi:MAG: hypothetical protein ABIY55_31225, partial [Kofleriaceae bacterium]